MLFESILPQLPTTVSQIIIYVVAMLGAILICYAIFVEKERRQDLILAIGALCLFVYALSIMNVLFMIAMGGFFIVTLIEFIEIYAGLHKHSPEDLKRYKAMK